MKKAFILETYRKAERVKEREKDRQCTYKRNIEALSRNRCSLGKAVSITYSECVSVALVTQ
jgi:hypothetical protein